MRIPKFAWVIIGLSPLILLVTGVVIWMSISSGMAKASFRTRAISILQSSNGNENNVDGLYKYTWGDGSSILTSFAEECSGESFEIYLIKTSDGKIFEVMDIHFCGIEGMGSVLGNYKGEKEFVGWIQQNHGHLIKND